MTNRRGGIIPGGNALALFPPFERKIRLKEQKKPPDAEAKGGKFLEGRCYLLAMPFVGGAGLFPAFPAPGVQDLPASPRFHPGTEAVIVLALLNGGLECHLHRSRLLLSLQK